MFEDDSMYYDLKNRLKKYFVGDRRVDVIPCTQRVVEFNCAKGKIHSWVLWKDTSTPRSLCRGFHQFSNDNIILDDKKRQERFKA